jgi:Flp pilus assembly protein TadD
MQLTKFRDQGLESVAVERALSQVVDDSRKKLLSLERIAQMTPNDPNARVELGLEYMRLGQHDSAAKELQRAKELGSTNKSAEYQRTIDYYAQENAKAKQLLEQRQDVQ